MASPGKRVDLCLNGRELRAGSPTEGASSRNVIGTGEKNLKFYERDPRTCRGTVLAKDSFAIGSGEDLTIVATRKAPKVLRFDNAGLGEIPPLGDSERLLPTPGDNGGRRRGLQLSRLGEPDRCPLAANGDLHERSTERQRRLGPEHGLPVPGHSRWEYQEVLSAPIFQTIASHRYEWILVGTSR